jgi:hypothetical protein
MLGRFLLLGRRVPECISFWSVLGHFWVRPFVDSSSRDFRAWLGFVSVLYQYQYQEK